MCEIFICLFNNSCYVRLVIIIMKELLKQLIAYQLWANQQILAVIYNLPSEKQQIEIASSFNSIYKTVLHIWDAESIWWQRIKLQERIQIPSQNFNGTMLEAGSGLLELNLLWKNWVENASTMSLEHVTQYYNNKKENFKQPVWQIVLHVVNHGTYHRGQLINMLRQVGVEKLPQTDFTYWTRKNKSPLS
jgi:uncharacterized damage-inducible protein DinB